MKRRLFRSTTLVLLLAWMILIFTLSAQTASESRETSAGFAAGVFSLFYPGFNRMTSAEQQQFLGAVSFAVRKMAHFSLYACLGGLSFATVIDYKRLSLLTRSALAWGICVLYAASDEFHQRFVPGRSGELRDVLIDSAGALLMITLLTLLFRFSGKLYSKVRRDRFE